LCRYGSPLVLIGLRFFDYEAYFDEIQLPLTDPDAVTALFTDDQMMIETGGWKMTILNLDRMLGRDGSRAVEGLVPAGMLPAASVRRGVGGLDLGRIERLTLIRDPRGIAQVARDLFANVPVSIGVRAPDDSWTRTRLHCGGTLFIPEQAVLDPNRGDPQESIVKTYAAPRLLLVGCAVDDRHLRFDLVFVPLRPAG